jgi:hypothetical protein
METCMIYHHLPCGDLCTTRILIVESYNWNSKKPNKLLLIESLDVNFLGDIIQFMAYKRKIMVNELRERIIIIISLYST